MGNWLSTAMNPPFNPLNGKHLRVIWVSMSIIIFIFSWLCFCINIKGNVEKYTWEVNLQFDYRLRHGGVEILEDYLDHWREASFLNTYQHVLILRRENLTCMKITEGHSRIPKYLFDLLGTKWSALLNRSWNPRQMEKDFSTICGMKLRSSNWILLVFLRCITNWTNQKSMFAAMRLAAPRCSTHKWTPTSCRHNGAMGLHFSCFTDARSWWISKYKRHH